MTRNLPQLYGHTVWPGMWFMHEYNGIKIKLCFSPYDYTIPFQIWAATEIVK